MSPNLEKSDDERLRNWREPPGRLGEYVRRVKRLIAGEKDLPQRPPTAPSR